MYKRQALNVAMPDRLYLPFVENQEYIAAILCELKSGPWEKEIGTILEQCAQWRAANLQIQPTAFGQAPSFGLTEKEAEYFLSLISGKSFEFPVAFDIEDNSQRNLSREEISNIVAVSYTHLNRLPRYQI